MEGGKIKAIGTHDELLEKCEAYALYCERSIYSGWFTILTRELKILKLKNKILPFKPYFQVFK